MATAHGILIDDDIPAFTKFLIKRGWKTIPTKGEYEVLRATRNGTKHPLLVYRRKNGVELTTHGVALTMAHAFDRYRRGLSEE